MNIERIHYMIGKLFGAVVGLSILKLPGAVLGLFIGHLFDLYYGKKFTQKGGFARYFSSTENPKEKAIFIHTLFVCLGHISKSDGQVTKVEIDIASRLMDDMKLFGQRRLEAQQSFTEGKAKDYPLKNSLSQFMAAYHGKRQFTLIFLEILISATFAKGTLSKNEADILSKIASILGFNQKELNVLIAHHEAEVRFRQHGSRGRSQSNGANRASTKSRGQQLGDAYKVLGVSHLDDEKTIKRAYKKLMAAHHPDKLVAKGLPEEALEIAKAKTQDIQAAYTLVKEAKKW